MAVGARSSGQGLTWADEAVAVADSSQAIMMRLQAWRGQGTGAREVWARKAAWRTRLRKGMRHTHPQLPQALPIPRRPALTHAVSQRVAGQEEHDEDHQRYDDGGQQVGQHVGGGGALHLQGRGGGRWVVVDSGPGGGRPVSKDAARSLYVVRG